MEKIYAAVYILDIPYRIDRRYVYFLPLEIRSSVSKGTLCVVPFGNANKPKSAVVVNFSETCDYRAIKPVSGIMDYPIHIPEELVDLCVFMKERFFCTFGNAMKTVLPPGINVGTATFYTNAVEELPDGYNTVSEVLFRFIKSKKKAFEKDIFSEYGRETEKLLLSLVKDGIIEKHSEVTEHINQKKIKLVRLTVDNEQAEQLLEATGKLTPKQKELISLLLNYPKISVGEIEEISGISASVVSALVKKGICEKYEDRIERTPYENAESEDFLQGESIKSPLSDEQTEAVNTLNELMMCPEPRAALLFGVTGSGKTRVIIEAVKKAVSLGKTAIVLIPEIGLTSQALSVYRAQFGEKLAVVHSMLSVGERIDTYRRITDGHINVVIGTRSAVFAPLSNIGVIIMDEEQESTYKSDLTPRYHTRDIVRFRCKVNKCLMVLASATPSIESFYKAKNGIYTLIRLTGRFGGVQLPEVLIEDLRSDEKVFPDKLIGSRLEAETSANTENKEQTIMFVNRRGYNSYLSCRSCGAVYTCPNCSVSLTYHAYSGTERRGERLSCHYCGYVCEPHRVCPECGGEHIGFFGFGTQKLQDEIIERFPDVKFIRMDTDTTSARYSHDKMLASFGEGEADILFGTQMVAKGLDFPNVSLVGVISVDTLLYMNDFRAGERTFSLITQLVGRAGRAKKRGRAVLQTYNPDNEILTLAAEQNYERFYESEILIRRAVLFPPFCSIAVFGISGENENAVWEYAKQLSASLDETHRKTHSGVRLIKFGPFKDGIYKIGGRYRHRIIIKYGDNAAARAYFNEVYSKLLALLPPAIKLELDINPSIV